MPELDLKKVVRTWLESCKRKGQISRNTVAVGIVVLDHLRKKCPLTRGDVFSETGSEVKGARSGLHAILREYGIPETFLKEATTRQASHDAERLLDRLEFGKTLGRTESETRDRALKAAIEVLRNRAYDWLKRQNLKISCDRQFSPSVWVHSILREAEGRSGGRVEQHLVGAKLQKRHPHKSVPNYPGHAGDLQTGRQADFDVDKISYHVTATPSRAVIQKCKTNAESNRHPVLVVPREKVPNARVLAEDEGIGNRLTILGLEDFMAANVIEISVEQGTDFFATLREIIEEYNRRVEEVETDLALKIELQ